MSNFITLLDKNKTNIIISNRDLRRSLFETVKKSSDYLYDIKFISFNDLINDCLGCYENNALRYIKEKYDITYSGASDYLSYYLLTNVKEKEEVNKYYHYNENDIYFYENKNIIVCNTSKYNNLIYKSISRLESLGIKINYYFNDELFLRNHILKKYDNNIEEVEGLAEFIIYLLNKGFDINKIYCDILSDSYKVLVEDVFKFYNLEYQFNDYESLISFEDTIKVLNYYINNKDIEINLDTFKDFTFNNKIDRIIEKKIEIILSETLETPFDIDYFKYRLEQNGISKNRYKNCVTFKHIIDSDIDDDSFYFIIGANQSFFPTPIKLSGLFTNEVLKENNLYDEKFLNTLQESYYLSKIKTIKNLYISYKLKDEEKEYIKANILNKLFVKGYDESKDTYHTSLKRDLLKYLKSKEIYSKYKTVNNNLKELYVYGTAFENNIIPYKNNFKLYDIDNFKEFTKNEIKFSYSSLTDYFECPFKYFLNDICKLDPFDSTYSTFLGSFFHEFIKNTIDKEFDQAYTDYLFNDYLERQKEHNKYVLTESDVFFFKYFYDSLESVHDTLKEKFDSINAKDIKKEESMEYKITRNGFTCVVKGTPDYLAVDDDNNVIVIDYKTGKPPRIDLENGLGMQFFIYFLIYNKLNGNKNNLVGTFFMKIDKTGLDPKQVSLAGEKINDENLLINYGIKDTFNARTKLSREELIGQVNLTKDKLDEAMENITSLDFEIKPLSKDSCKFCNFKDICMKYEGIDFDDEEEGNDESN